MNKSIVIKSSHKGGNIVIISTEGYEKMCCNIIHNRKWYRPITASFVIQSTKQCRNILIRAHNRGPIDVNTFTFLDTTNSHIPTFYALPNVDKGELPPPGCSIISGCGSLTENASQIINEYLYPHVKSLSSHIKDTI